MTSTFHRLLPEYGWRDNPRFVQRQRRRHGPLGKSNFLGLRFRTLLPPKQTKSESMCLKMYKYFIRPSP